MNWFSALVLFAVIWFLSLFVVLPIGVRTQGEDGEIVPGTPASAPSNPDLKRKLTWTTIIAIAIWVPLCAFIIWGGVTIRDLDFWHRM